MSLEIERKFLVANEGWKTAVLRSVRIRDGLIANNKGHKARVRIANDVVVEQPSQRGPKDLSDYLEDGSSQSHVCNLQMWGLRWREQNKKIDTPSTPGSGKLEDRTMLISDGVQKRNAFAVCAEFRIEGLEASLDCAREIAFQQELDAVGHHIEEAKGYLAQIRVLHQEALDEFSRAQGE